MSPTVIHFWLFIKRACRFFHAFVFLQAFQIYSKSDMCWSHCVFRVRELLTKNITIPFWFALVAFLSRAWVYTKEITIQSFKTHFEEENNFKFVDPGYALLNILKNRDFHYVRYILAWKYYSVLFFIRRIHKFKIWSPKIYYNREYWLLK